MPLLHFIHSHLHYMITTTTTKLHEDSVEGEFRNYIQTRVT